MARQHYCPSEELFTFGLRDCPAMGNRPITPECWDGKHKHCFHDGCRCVCHEKPEPKVQLPSEMLGTFIDEQGKEWVNGKRIKPWNKRTLP